MLKTIQYIIEEIHSYHCRQDPLKKVSLPLAPQDPLTKVPIHQNHHAPPLQNLSEKVGIAASQST